MGASPVSWFLQKGGPLLRSHFTMLLVTQGVKQSSLCSTSLVALVFVCPLVAVDRVCTGTMLDGFSYGSVTELSP